MPTTAPKVRVVCVETRLDARAGGCYIRETHKKQQKCVFLWWAVWGGLLFSLCTATFFTLYAPRATHGAAPHRSAPLHGGLRSRAARRAAALPSGPRAARLPSGTAGGTAGGTPGGREMLTGTLSYLYVEYHIGLRRFFNSNITMGM